MKICSKCKIEKELGFFHKNKKCAGGHNTICKSCSKEYHIQWVKKNPDKVKINHKKYFQSERGKDNIKRWRAKQGPKSDFVQNIKKWRIKHYADNRDKYLKRHKKIAKKYHAKIIDTLDDVYVKSKLRQQGFPLCSINSSIIEIKRLQLKTKREIKNHENKD